jgi:lysophospholipase L1-like esterase
VDLNASLQWHAFQRMIGRLRERGNDVLVVLGPFNEHLMAEENRPEYRKIRDGIAAWLEQNRIPAVVPDTLPSELYADASHPLTQGYELLAKRIYADGGFRKWLE